MARLPRALILFVLLLPLMACRFSPSHRAAVVRFAVSTILDIASGEEAPAVQVAQQPVRTEALCAHHSAGEKAVASAETVETMRVRPISIDRAALRPAAECHDSEVGVWRIARLRHPIDFQHGRICAADRNATVPLLDMRIHRTIGG